MCNFRSVGLMVIFALAFICPCPSWAQNSLGLISLSNDITSATSSGLTSTQSATSTATTSPTAQPTSTSTQSSGNSMLSGLENLVKFVELLQRLQYALMGLQMGLPPYQGAGSSVQGGTTTALQGSSTSNPLSSLFSGSQLQGLGGLGGSGQTLSGSYLPFGQSGGG